MHRNQQRISWARAARPVSMTRSVSDSMTATARRRRAARSLGVLGLVLVLSVTIAGLPLRGQTTKSPAANKTGKPAATTSRPTATTAAKPNRDANGTVATSPGLEQFSPKSRDVNRAVMQKQLDERSAGLGQAAAEARRWSESASGATNANERAAARVCAGQAFCEASLFEEARGSFELAVQESPQSEWGVVASLFLFDLALERQLDARRASAWLSRVEMWSINTARQLRTQNASPVKPPVADVTPATVVGAGKGASEPGRKSSTAPPRSGTVSAGSKQSPVNKPNGVEPGTEQVAGRPRTGSSVPPVAAPRVAGSDALNPVILARTAEQVRASSIQRGAYPWGPAFVRPALPTVDRGGMLTPPGKPPLLGEIALRRALLAVAAEHDHRRALVLAGCESTLHFGLPGSHPLSPWVVQVNGARAPQSLLSGEPPLEVLDVGDEEVSRFIHLANLWHDASQWRRAADLWTVLLETFSERSERLSPAQRSFIHFRRAVAITQAAVNALDYDVVSIRSDYEQAVALVPRADWVAEALFAWGEFDWRVNSDADAAVTRWTKLLDEHPQHRRADQAAYMIGVAYELASRWKEADQAFRSAQTRFPESSRQRLIVSHLAKVQKQLPRQP